MTTTYQVAPAAYDHHGMPSYSASFAPARMPPMADPVRPSQFSRHPSQQAPAPAPTQPQIYSQPTPVPRDPASGASHYSAVSRYSTKPTTPAGETSIAAGEDAATASRRSSQTLIHHSLQIPTRINPKGGNLADFSAQITCLFWFESMDTLRAAETIRSRPPTTAVPHLTKYATPFSAFKKWAYGVLSTTQVTQSVILLALLFIYRLKKINPSVKGRSGSEYRLLTVALMLGNKFLDDNTYTNKTWADVSGISVQEIHVMEVEFLSNMRYSLLATRDEWEEWLNKLACFSEFYERAQRQSVSPVMGTSPVGHAFSSPLPSPTAGPQNGHVSYTNPAGAAPVQTWSSSFNNAQAVSPLSSKSTLAPVTRKRGLEDDMADHPAKRPTMQPVRNQPVQRPPVVGEQPIRLPVPNLSLNTSTAPNGQVPYVTQNTYPATVPAQVSLPPLVPGVRAMATVYPGVNNQMPVQLPLPASTAPQTTAPHPALTPTNTMAPHAGIMGYGTPSKRHSPGMLAAYGSSPMTDGYHVQSAVHTPMHTPMSHSPSVYLQQRPSPYKPVRHVNTLLYPPPSASLHEYHMSMTAPQMHYLPLGRRNDLRTGVVPEYMMMGYRGGPPQQLPPHQLPPHGHGQMHPTH
ncbi:cyclin-domain-containing protein [Plectosphaerella cucumerina]|uniref:Cyclin-domain-containing protein n=1 Tax=Plectosphaerella cucumerina TaxID=40658 RepID=A0A8K0TEV6_9PEZI|nr:cyclin-domain-containing protein [Plectosphaerella cucumerina]